MPMGILRTFIEQASNLWWGIIAAVVIVAIIYFTLYMLMGGSKSFSPFGFVLAIPLLVLLSIQFFLLFGSISLKHTCTEISAWIDAFVPEFSEDGAYSREDVNAAISHVVAAFPVSAKLIDAELVAQEEDMSLGETLTHKVHSYLNWFIVRRVLWSLGFIVLTVLGVILIQPKVTSSYPSQRREYRERPRPARRNRR